MGSGLRITGGKWRGKRVICPLGSHMRPTSDINRQRMFNWLGEAVVGASVLDLFAGSGVLSWEALSRGASNATLVEMDPATVHHLYSYRKLLGVEDCVVIVTAKLPQRINRVPINSYDLVFVDPPFGYGLAVCTCNSLVEFGYITSNTLVYLECESGLDLTLLLEGGWRVHLSSINGEVAQYILQFAGAVV